MNNSEAFYRLHHQSTPLILANVWDVNSAKIFEANGYKAIGTSSHALAAAWGYEDGEEIPFDIVLKVAKRVVEAVRIPFSVDMEGGYDRSVKSITENIQKLHDVGVVGINFEDSVMNASRELQDKETFRETLEQVANYVSRNNLSIFINLRTDPFLLGVTDALDQTLERIKVYEAAGANGIFVPCVTDERDIVEIVQATKLPINVMCMPALPSFGKLTALGVKRISMGPFLFNKSIENIATLSRNILKDESFASFFI